VRVLVLYSHPLMGEGLQRMLADEPGVIVEAVDVTDDDGLCDALAASPAVIVVEEGGPVDAAEILRRCSGCSMVLDVDITTMNAYTLRREVLASRPDDFLATIRQAVGASAPVDKARSLQARPVPG
jgi:DNA-binding NarL/FixJ family response regulator